MAYLPGVGVSMVVLRHSHIYDYQARKDFPLLSRIFMVYNNFRTFVPNIRLPRRKENHQMSKVDQLISYILTLTPEQADKLVSQIPRLNELLSKSSQPCPQEQTEQIQ